MSPTASLTQAMSAEKISLESIVHHRLAIPHDLPMEEVHDVFRQHDFDFLALVRDEQVTGLCSRGRLGNLLGSRYGFALYCRSPAHLAQVDAPMVFRRDTPVREILDRALARSGTSFYEDVALVDGELHLLGLIPVESLAQLQSRLVAEQLEALRCQNLALRQAEGLTRGLFESNALGVALLDAHGVVQAHNRRLTELLNLAEGVEVPTLASWIGERGRILFEPVLRQHEREGRASVTAEYSVVVPGRGIRLFRFYTGWIGEMGRICACIDDITQQRANERHLQRQEKQRLLDTLVGGIAHELNNKLTPVLGFAEMLAAGGEQSPQVAGYIAKSATEAGNIIRQLLQLSKPEAADTRTIDLRQVVDESLVMLKFKLRESGAEVRVSAPSGRVAVMADPGQLKQVVINLALNALQAMEDAPAPVLEIEVILRGEQAFVRVADNGSGISPEIIGRIFDPFFTTKGPDRGSGLGLSVSYSIVQQCGGDIAVESEPGGGACFTVSLPVATETAEPRPEPAGVPLPGSASRPSGQRVLIVEDEEVVSKLIQEVLRSFFGCDVDLAGNGAEALGRAETGDYALIVSDLRMPQMSGTEFYLRLRDQRPDLARCLVFVTGHAGDKSLEQQIVGWNVPIVPKPFTPRRLVEACASILAPAEPSAESA